MRVRGFVSRLNCTTKAFHAGRTCVPWLAPATGRRGSGVRFAFMFAFTARRIAGMAEVVLTFFWKSSGKFVEADEVGASI